jgi:hypothetical protein
MMNKYLLLITGLLFAQHTFSDLSNLDEWSGLSAGRLSVTGAASYRYPDGERGHYRKGFRFEHDGSGNWVDQYGIRFELKVPSDELLNLTASIEIAPFKQGREMIVDRFTAKTGVIGEGWHTVTIPISAFDYEKDRPFVLEIVKEFSLAAEFADGRKADVELKNPRLVKADVIALECDVRSKPGKAGETVSYTMELTNCTDQPLVVTLARSVRGREVMDTAITPSTLTLAPGERRPCEIAVTVSERVAPGGRESQVIQALANGKDAGELEFITLAELPHPYIVHTPERWDDVREKCRTVDWAKKELQAYIDYADNYTIPEVAADEVADATQCHYLFKYRTAQNIMRIAATYQITGDLRHAEKVADFLKRLSDPETGYPSTWQGIGDNLVHEGNFFQYTAMAYDMIYNTGLLSDEDHANLDRCFRMYHQVIKQHVTQGTIGNWQVAELLGCIYTSLVMQDWVSAQYFMHMPAGLFDQMKHGVMGDGWWFECSIHYNTWVSSEFTQFALALQPFGVDYQYAAFPLTYSKDYNIPYTDVENMKKNTFGHPFQKWGPVHKPSFTIKDMWDALPPYVDYTGTMFANNDSYENRFTRNYYEIGYFVYRDPMYAAIIKNAPKRDLIYGVGELPEDTPALGKGAAFSDNVGATMLRSTQEDARERNQGVLKYGTHGGYHGHFDRAALNSLMRYGRSFYNPEHIWYGYASFMYKFFVQTSLPHNMVVVDMLQQEAVESHKLMFSTNELMQVTAVETEARWSPPPYGGLKYDHFFGTFQEKCWDEGRFMPQPENEPAYGSIGEWSDRVTQRRLMAVTDDYVVLADYLEAPEEHTFDCMFQIKGFQGINAEPVRHTEQMDPNPILAAQLITDCKWYETKGTTKVSFETQFGKDADNKGTRIVGQDGLLKMDVYSAWPKEREVMIGTLPESHGVNRKFRYTVKGDEQTLAEGQFGAWILGRDEIDVSVEGINTLILQTQAEFKDNAAKTLFWGNPVIVTANGKALKLSDLKLKVERIDNTPESGVDYYGGPVKISGKRFDESVAANPLRSGEPGTVTVDLTGLNAVRFKASVGGDYPLGDEIARRKSLSFRTRGKVAQYLTVIEPYEKERFVQSVKAQSANELTVELNDGRKHVITFSGLDTGESITAKIQVMENGNLVKEEFHCN